MGILRSGAWSSSIRTALARLTGVFQDHYFVNGVVSGKEAFITLTDDDWVEYTVELRRKSREELIGFYSPSVPFLEKDANELLLTRIGD